MGLNLLNGGLGALTGFLTTGNPIGALAGGVEGALQGGGPSGAGNLGPTTDPTLPAQQALDQWAEWDQYILRVYLARLRQHSAASCRAVQ